MKFKLLNGLYKANKLLENFEKILIKKICMFESVFYKRFCYNWTVLRNDCRSNISGGMGGVGERLYADLDAPGKLFDTVGSTLATQGMCFLGAGGDAAIR